ncbi:hypothetical protein LXL04_016284 [Taraxacum kok-saghyz]
MPVECPNLRSLDLSVSKLRTFDLRLTPNLEELRFGEGHANYVELHMSGICFNLRSLVLFKMELRAFDIRLTPNLRNLHLEHSKFMRTLDTGFTLNLEVLSVSCCDDLEELQMADEYVNLKRLTLFGLKLSTLTLGPCPNLEFLSIYQCRNLEEFNMAECPILKYIYIYNLNLRILDLRLVPNLIELHLTAYDNLVELHLPNRCINLSTLKCTCLKLRTLDLAPTPNLKTLHLHECRKLVELRAPIGWLKNLVFLDLTGCLGFKLFSFDLVHDTSGRVSESRGVHPLAKLAFKLKRCTFHPDNRMPKFEITCFHEEDLRSLTTSLEKLISEGPCACTKLETFSRSINIKDA